MTAPTIIDWVERLDPWHRAGVLSFADAHIAHRLATLGGLTEADEPVVFAAALAARAPRNGHVCLDLRTVRESAAAEVDASGPDTDPAAVDQLPWPADPQAWRQAIAASPLVAIETAAGLSAPDRPLVLRGDLLYLERYRVLEAQIAADITARVEQTVLVPVAADPQRLSQLLDDLTLSAEQRGAVDRGLARSFSVIVGGPGTGKTHTVAALLVALLDHAPTEEPLRIALAAPTGKAAARMGEAIAAAASRLATLPLEGAPALAEQLTRAEPSTIHRLLGTIPDSTRFRHDRIDPLPHDVVIIDETSMVSLPLLAKLLAAVPPTSRVVLVGDPGQLASVEAGSVLGDIAGPVVLAADGGPDAPATALADSITVLRESRRFPTESPVGRFAAAVRTGDIDAATAILGQSIITEPAEPAEPAEASNPDPPNDAATETDRAAAVTVRWFPHDVTSPGADTLIAAEALADARHVRDLALTGDSAAALAGLDRVRVLCAHRRGPFGVARWNHQFDQWLFGGAGPAAAFPIGRPIMVTRNDPGNGLFNGDLGVVVAAGDDQPAGSVRVAFADPSHVDGVRLLSPARLAEVETVHAMTIHKSQGSEFDEVVIVMPPADSPLATRELLYTAVTRARRSVVIIGSIEALTTAIRVRVTRASGLGDRLWSAPS